MTDLSEQALRRGMSFPFFLTVVLFAAILADRFLSDDSPVARPGEHPYGLAAVALISFLLWLWVLVAARRRATRFEGPIETARGSNGALQPILATIFIVVGANLAYNHTIPKWLGGAVSMVPLAPPGTTEPVVDMKADFDALDAPAPESPETTALEDLQTARELLDAISGTYERQQRDKTGRAQRESPP
jgi:hypothetical protein